MKATFIALLLTIGLASSTVASADTRMTDFKAALETVHLTSDKYACMGLVANVHDPAFSRIMSQAVLYHESFNARRVRPNVVDFSVSFFWHAFWLSVPDASHASATFIFSAIHKRKR